MPVISICPTIDLAAAIWAPGSTAATLPGILRAIRRGAEALRRVERSDHWRMARADLARAAACPDAHPSGMSVAEAWLAADAGREAAQDLRAGCRQGAALAELARSGLAVRPAVRSWLARPAMPGGSRWAPLAGSSYLPRDVGAALLALIGQEDPRPRIQRREYSAHSGGRIAPSRISIREPQTEWRGRRLRTIPGQVVADLGLSVELAACGHLRIWLLPVAGDQGPARLVGDLGILPDGARWDADAAGICIRWRDDLAWHLDEASLVRRALAGDLIGVAELDAWHRSARQAAEQAARRQAGEDPLAGPCARAVAQAGLDPSRIVVRLADSLVVGNCPAGTAGWSARYLSGARAASVARVLAAAERTDAPDLQSRARRAAAQAIARAAATIAAWSPDRRARARDILARLRPAPAPARAAARWLRAGHRAMAAQAAAAAGWRRG
jgi:hypothetical protein